MILYGHTHTHTRTLAHTQTRTHTRAHTHAHAHAHLICIKDAIIGDNIGSHNPTWMQSMAPEKVFYAMHAVYARMGTCPMQGMVESELTQLKKE
jgi:hypothetical protein